MVVTLGDVYFLYFHATLTDSVRSVFSCYPYRLSKVSIFMLPTDSVRSVFSRYHRLSKVSIFTHYTHHQNLFLYTSVLEKYLISMLVQVQILCIATLKYIMYWQMCMGTSPQPWCKQFVMYFMCQPLFI